MLKTSWQLAQCTANVTSEVAGQAGCAPGAGKGTESFQVKSPHKKTLFLTLPEALESGFKAVCKTFSQNLFSLAKGMEVGE